MKNSEIFKNVEMQIRNRNLDNQATAMIKFKTAILDEDFHKLDTKWRQLVLQEVKLEAEKKSTDKLKNQIKDVYLKREKQLNKLGFNIDDFKIQYTCNECKDTGIVNGHRCNCFNKIYHQKLFEASNINIKHSYYLKDFAISCYENKDEGAKLLAFITKYINEFGKSSYNNLLLVGATGSGKTFISEVIANELINKNYLVTFYTSFQISQMLLKWHSENFDEKEVLAEQVLDADLLIIDDLGTEPIYKNVSLQYYQSIIDTRMFYRKPTIITTNLLPEQMIDLYGDRLFSRLYNNIDSVVLKLNNWDIRKKQK